MVNKKITMIFLIAVILTIYVGNAAAQMTDAEIAKAATERTGEVIKEANAIITDSRSQIARISLEKAIALQARAMSQLEAHHNNFAYKYTMQARKEAWHAIALARADARIEEKLVNLSEHTREKLFRLRERIVENGVKDDRLFGLMNRARNLLEESHMNTQQLRNKLALNLAENARKLAVRSEERFRKVLDLKEMSERRLMLMERLITRARERVDQNGDEEDRLRLQQAIQSMERAKEMIGEGKYHAARISIEKCERILRNFARHISRDEAGNIDRELEEGFRLFSRAREHFADSDRFAGVLQRAEALLARAREEIAQGRTEEAKKLIARARMLLRKAVQSQDHVIEPGQVENNIESIMEIRDNIGIGLVECQAEGAQNLFERANRHLDSAIGFFEKRRFGQADAEARIARNIYQRIREICTN